jgi:DNA-directed RNA polymerase specialized sigma24 family protein
VFRTRQQLMDALARLGEDPGPGSISLISVDRVKRATICEPFRPGFLASVDRRSELLALLRRLDERSQRLLLLWFVKDRPPAEIANDLGVSRVHCYRLRNRALDEMLEPGERRRETPRAS